MMLKKSVVIVSLLVLTISSLSSVEASGKKGKMKGLEEGQTTLDGWRHPLKVYQEQMQKEVDAESHRRKVAFAIKQKQMREDYFLKHDLGKENQKLD